MTENNGPVENQVTFAILQIGFLWLDRAMVRMFPLSLPALFLCLYWPNYAGLTITILVIVSSTWAIVDLYRGYYLDHETSDVDLRDLITVRRE